MKTISPKTSTLIEARPQRSRGEASSTMEEVMLQLKKNLGKIVFVQRDVRGV